MYYIKPGVTELSAITKKQTILLNVVWLKYILLEADYLAINKAHSRAKLRITTPGISRELLGIIILALFTCTTQSRISIFIYNTLTLKLIYMSKYEQINDALS